MTRGRGERAEQLGTSDPAFFAARTGGARRHSPVLDHPCLVWTLLRTPGATTLFSKFVLDTVTFLGSFLFLSSSEDCSKPAFSDYLLPLFHTNHCPSETA